MKNVFLDFKTCLILFALLLFLSVSSYAQIAINTDGSSPDASAMLDVKSSSKGLLIPRMTTTQRNTLAATAVAGLMVYDTDLNKFFFFDGSLWREGSVGNLWSKSGSYTYLTNTTDFVGIGTNTPATELEVTNATGQPDIRITRPSTSYAAALSFYTGSTSEWNFLTASGNTNMLLYRGSGNTTGNLGLMHSGGSVGIGTTSPARTFEVKGPWQTARISSTSSGATLEFVSTVKDDWGITTWDGNMAFMFSSNDFASKTDEYYFTNSSIYPFTSNANSLGLSGNRWSNLYSVLGNFSGAVSTGDLTTTGNATFTGSIGVGTTSPGYDIDVNKSSGTAWIRAKSASSYAGLMIDKGATTANGYLIYKTLGSDKWYMGMIGNDNFAISTSFSGPDGKFYINSSGQVGIGTTSLATGYKLSVAGKVICEELRVNAVADWPDYVFGKGYKLMSLRSLEKFIEDNHHLPGVPSSGEVEESGMDVGEMQRLMMEKIEELTLYLIRQQKEIETLKEQLNKQTDHE